MNSQIPIVSFFSFIKNSKNILKNPMPFYRKNFEKHGDVYQLNMGFGNSAILTRDQALIKYLLQTQHKNYYKSPLQSKDLAHYVGTGLLTSNGAYWLKQRRLIQPAFYKKKLENVKTIIVDTIKADLEQIKIESSESVLPIMRNLAFNVVSKSLFSYADDDGKTIARLQNITATIQSSLIKEIRQPYKKWWFKLNGHIKNTEAEAEEAREILKDVIEKRKNSKESYDDLLDMLLASKYEDGSSMTMDQLIDEILILFMAGHETTYNALTFALMLLAQHPEIQEKIYQEAMGINASELSMMEFFAQAPYTKKCIDEAMRLYPPVYFSDRIAIEDDSFMGLNFKKGTSFFLSFYEIHRNPEFWENPERYYPERFDTISKKELSDWFFPFGAGPRMCVGSNMAMYEMLVTVTEIIKKYDIKPSFEDIKIKPLITLNPDEANLIFEIKK